MKLLSKLPVFVLLVLASCTNDDSEEGKTITGFNLLPKGRMKSTYTDNNSFPTTFQFDDSLHIGGTEVYLFNIGGTKSYITKNLVEPLFYSRNDSLFYADSMTYSDGKITGFVNSTLVFPSTFKVGSTWKIGGFTAVVEALNENITVPGGTFDCVRIRIADSGSFWVSKNNGFIKMAEGSSFVMLTSLTKY